MSSTHLPILVSRVEGRQPDILSVFCAGPYGRRSYDDMADTESAIGYSSYFLASNRVSRMLDLAGASMSIDCASASALVAVHMAAGEACQGRAATNCSKFPSTCFKTRFLELNVPFQIANYMARWR